MPCFAEDCPSKIDRGGYVSRQVSCRGIDVITASIDDLSVDSGRFGRSRSRCRPVSVGVSIGVGGGIENIDWYRPSCLRAAAAAALVVLSERYEEEGIGGLFKDKRHKVPKQMTPGTKGFVVDKADKGMNAPEIQKEVEKKRKDENDDRSAPSIQHIRRTLNKEGGKYTRRRSGPGSSSTGRGTGAASTTWCCAWRTSSRRSSRKMGTEPSKTLPLSLILSKHAIVAYRTVLISPYCSFFAGSYPHAPEFSPKAPTLV